MGITDSKKNLRIHEPKAQPEQVEPEAEPEPSYVGKGKRSKGQKVKSSNPQPEAVPEDKIQKSITCLGCGKKFLLLLSHLERTKTCQNSYDMSAMREEAERLHREKMAARNRYLYHNDPSVSSRKRAASMKLYQESPK